MLWLQSWYKAACGAALTCITISGYLFLANKATWKNTALIPWIVNIHKLHLKTKTQGKHEINWKFTKEIGSYLSVTSNCISVSVKLK